MKINKTAIVLTGISLVIFAIALVLSSCSSNELKVDLKLLTEFLKEKNKEGKFWNDKLALALKSLINSL